MDEEAANPFHSQPIAQTIQDTGLKLCNPAKTDDDELDELDEGLQNKKLRGEQQIDKLMSIAYLLHPDINKIDLLITELQMAKVSAMTSFTHAHAA